MRVVDVGERVQVNPQHLVRPESLHRLQLLSVPVGQGGHDLFRTVVGELLLQVLRPELLEPERVGRRDVARPLRLLAVEGIDVLPVEFELRGPQRVGNVGGALLHPLEIPGEDGLGRLGIAGPAGGLRQRRTVRRELVHVRLQKEGPTSIQGIQVPIEQSGGQRAVERVVRELGMLQDAGGEARDVGFRRMRVGRGGGRPTAEPGAGEHGCETERDERSGELSKVPGHSAFHGHLRERRTSWHTGPRELDVARLVSTLDVPHDPRLAAGLQV